MSSAPEAPQVGSDEVDGDRNMESESASNPWDGRPRYKTAGASKFVVNDEVYVRSLPSMLGPYFIASVVRPKVYVLCDESGNYINNGAEVAEATLIAARQRAST
ncbi:hypothetical protein E8E14_000082 [Neopestalotiopsis sp. 37M]|nr:hypothetical protein E8E14_000082 [Neopestalotiopsis sp. 37M]